MNCDQNSEKECSRTEIWLKEPLRLWNVQAILLSQRQGTPIHVEWEFWVQTFYHKTCTDLAHTNNFWPFSLFQDLVQMVTNNLFILKHSCWWLVIFESAKFWSHISQGIVSTVGFGCRNFKDGNGFFFRGAALSKNLGGLNFFDVFPDRLGRFLKNKQKNMLEFIFFLKTVSSLEIKFSNPWSFQLIIVV